LGQGIPSICSGRNLERCTSRLSEVSFQHARISALDCAAARSAPGIVAVITPQDLLTLGTMSVGAPQFPAVARRYVMPPTYAHFVGEPIAAIVAETAAQAVDAIELVEVEYDALPGVASVSAAAEPDAPLVDLAARIQQCRVSNHERVGRCG
jgi:carbon-monoxide dehydrogenase large subunit